MRKPRKSRPGMAALREIRKLQATSDLLIQKMPFMRLVRQIVQIEAEKLGIKDGLRMTGAALLALQEASESYLTEYFEDVNLLAIHGGRVTIKAKDVQLWRKLRGLTYRYDEDYRTLGVTSVDTGRRKYMKIGSAIAKNRRAGMYWRQEHDEKTEARRAAREELKKKKKSTREPKESEDDESMSQSTDNDDEDGNDQDDEADKENRGKSNRDSDDSDCDSTTKSRSKKWKKMSGRAGKTTWLRVGRKKKQGGNAGAAGKKKRTNQKR